MYTLIYLLFQKYPKIFSFPQKAYHLLPRSTQLHQKFCTSLCNEPFAQCTQRHSIIYITKNKTKPLSLHHFTFPDIQHQHPPLILTSRNQQILTPIKPSASLLPNLFSADPALLSENLAAAARRALGDAPRAGQDLRGNY